MRTTLAKINKFIYLPFRKVKTWYQLLSEFLKQSTYKDYMNWKAKDDDKPLWLYGIEKALNEALPDLFIGLLLTFAMYVYGITNFTFGLILANSVAFWLLKVVVKTLKGR